MNTEIYPGVQIIDNTIALPANLSDLHAVSGYDPQTAWNFGRTEARNVGSAWDALERQPKRPPRRGFVALLAALIS